MIGNYNLIIRFGDAIVPFSTSVLRELTIIQDMNKLLPEFRFRMLDATGAITHVVPFDQNVNKVQFEFAQDYETKDINLFEFSVFTREPGAGQSNPSTEYDISGLLDVTKLFSPDYSRGLPGSIKTTLELLALEELGVTGVEVSSGLDYEKTLIQPTWTNAQLLNKLKEYLIGRNGEYGYKCFIKNYQYKKIFVFKSISEMIKNPISYKFILNDMQYQDQLPIFEYYIFDNYKLYGVFGTRTQSYSYFNYETSQYIRNTEVVEDYISLSDFYLIDKNDSMDSNEINDTGRSNDFTSDFKGKIKSSFGNRLLGLTKMWITTVGLPNAVPGQTIQVFFPHGATEGGENLYSFQYSGYWLVERVVHNFGDVFLTKLLLTRHGLDTDKSTSLLAATSKV